MRRTATIRRTRGFTRANVAGAVGALGFVGLLALYLVSLVWPHILGKV